MSSEGNIVLYLWSLNSSCLWMTKGQKNCFYQDQRFILQAALTNDYFLERGLQTPEAELCFTLLSAAAPSFHS